VVFTGDSVTITGSGFTGATAVNFGSTPVTYTVDSDTQITVNNVPAGIDGTVEVTVTTPYRTSATSTADQFTCTVQAPTDNEKYNNEEHNGDRDNNYCGPEYGGYGCYSPCTDVWQSYVWQCTWGVC